MDTVTRRSLFWDQQPSQNEKSHLYVAHVQRPYSLQSQTHTHNLGAPLYYQSPSHAKKNEPIIFRFKMALEQQLPSSYGVHPFTSIHGPSRWIFLTFETFFCILRPVFVCFVIRLCSVHLLFCFSFTTLFIYLFPG